VKKWDLDVTGYRESNVKPVRIDRKITGNS